MHLTHKVFLVIVLLALGAGRAHAGTLTVMWDPNPESHVTGYIVYVGTQPGVHAWAYDVGNVTSFVFPNATAGQLYHIAVAAYAPGPLVSPKSSEVSGYSNAPPTLTHPGNQTSRVGEPAMLQLQGSDPYGEPVSYAASGLPPGLMLTPSTGLIQGVGTTAGTFQVSASVSDGVLSDAKSFTWKMDPPLADTQAPVVAVISPSSASSFTSTLASLTLAGTASDNVGVTSVTWSNDRGGSGTASGTSSWTASGIPLKLGTNVITVRAHDAAGNQGTAVVSVTYVDAVAPVVAITSPTSAATFTASSSSLALGGTASDNVGVTSVTWSNDRGGSGTASGTSSWTASGIPLKFGTNVITVRAHDAAGNQGSAVISVTYADSEAPVVAITSPTSASTFTTGAASVSLGGTASDNVGVTTVTWVNNRGGSGTASGTTSWTVAGIPLQLGTNVLTVTAHDAAGNKGSAIVTVTYQDTTAPVVTLVSPTAGSTFSTSAESVMLAGTASDNIGVTSVSWSADTGAAGVASGTTSWSTGSIALRVGDTRIVVTAHDAAGNQSSVTLTVSMTPPPPPPTASEDPDTIAPTVSITSPTKGAKHNTSLESVLVSGVAADEVGVTMVTWTNSLGGGGTAQGTSSWLFEVPLQEGDNVLTVTARDAAGNTGQATLTVSRKTQGGRK